MNKQVLTKEEIKDIIEGNGIAERIPMMFEFWTHPSNIGELNREEIKKIIEQFPQDVQSIAFKMPLPDVAPIDDPTYKWLNIEIPKIDENSPFDNREYITDWDKIDEIIENFPNSKYNNLFTNPQEQDGRYRLGYWWYCFFERLWSLRGMENALTDFYLYPDEVKKLFDKFSDFYCDIIERGKKEQNLDGIFVSDDIGTQTSTFFSKEIFDEFFKPYYKKICDKCHSLGMHFWLHSCGNIENFMEGLIEAGVDVIHPIQKYTMDQAKIAKDYGDKICIWAGFDMQQIIPYGTPDEVRQEVRNMIDTYFNPRGRFMFTAGNQISKDCTHQSYFALCDESYHYGMQKVSEYVNGEKK